MSKQDRELVLLIDEIEAPFLYGSGNEFRNKDELVLLECLKQLFSSCRTIFTGSGIVTAMLHMTLAKNNDNTFLGPAACIDMGEPLPNPNALPVMVQAVAEAKFLPGPGRPSVDVVLDAMAVHPVFAGNGPIKQPV